MLLKVPKKCLNNPLYSSEGPEGPKNPRIAPKIFEKKCWEESNFLSLKVYERHIYKIHVCMSDDLRKNV